MNDDQQTTSLDASHNDAISRDMSRHVETEGASNIDMSIHVQTDAVDDTLNLSRHIATSLDRARFTLSVKQSTELFADAGVPRSARAITRYCKQGEIDFIPVDTERNAKWLLDRQSVERRIEQLRQSVLFAEEDQSVSRHVETADENNVDMSRQKLKKQSRHNEMCLDNVMTVQVAKRQHD